MTFGGYAYGSSALGSKPSITELLIPPCPLEPKKSGDTINFRTNPTGGFSPYTVEFRKDNILIDPSLLIDEFGQPSISNPLTNIAENTLLNRIYTLTDVDVAAAVGGLIQFSVRTIDSCPSGVGGPSSCEKVCDITIVCVSPICNFVIT